MSFDEVIAELPLMNLEQRQLLVRNALALDDLPLSNADERLVDQRLADHHDNPGSSVSVAEMSAKLRSRFCQ